MQYVKYKNNDDSNIPSVSIVVPVYNVAKYIRRCLDSLMAQTYQNFEILLIDDGSIDESDQICDEYAKLDKRIKVVHKKNGGVATARQTGTDIAIGEYIIHADPDDWVEPTMLEELLARAEQTGADVTICDYYVSDNRECRYVCQQPPSLDAESVLCALFHRLHGSLWNKLVKRACYIQYNLRFIPEVNYCEDVLIWVQLLQHPEVKIAYLNKAFYYYYQGNIESITHKWTSDFIESTRNYHNALELLLPNEMKHELDDLKMKFTFSLWYHKEITYRELLSNHYRFYDILHCDTLRMKQKIGYIIAIFWCPGLSRVVLSLRRFWKNN